MNLIALDLSSVSTGYAIFKNGKLESHGQIQPDKKLNIDRRLHFVVKKLESFIKNVDELVIEDTYYGSNVDVLKDLSKIAGAVIFVWLEAKNNIPTFISPMTARTTIGLKGNSLKAETQLWVIRKYNLSSEKLIKEYEKKIKDILNSTEKEEYILGLKKKQFKFGSAPFKKIVTSIKQLKNKRKYQLDKLSKEIEEKLKLGNDEADSIVVGLAYIKKGSK